MTLEESVRVGELQLQLLAERKKNQELTQQLDSIAGNEIWIIIASHNISHYKIDFCVSTRAILQARTSEVFALALFGQVQKMLLKLVKEEIG